MLTYKGYTGIVEYDSDGKIFTGEVIDLKDVITFQGRNTDELERSFRDSVDFYLEMCARDGRPPERPYSGRLNLRLTPELHHQLALQAAKEKKSLNQFIAGVLSKEIRQ